MEISDLIVKHLLRNLNPEEEIALKLWLRNPSNKKTFDRICNGQYIKRQLNKNFEIDLEEVWDSVAKKTVKKKSTNIFWRYAAAILLPIGLFSALLFLTEIPEYVAKVDQIDFEIAKGDQPLLITNEGIELALGLDTILNVDNSNLVVNKDDMLYSDPENKVNDSIYYNILKTPKGIKYKLTLSDGSNIWLNSESIFKYPVRFVGHNREVFLVEGEACFNVVKDKEKPFIVNFSESKIKVLGTEFNVKAYKEEQYQQITLIEGSVSIEKYDNSIILEPGQQALINQHRNQLSIHDVDTDLYTAWRDDLLAYKDEKLGTIIMDLERQYELKVFYESQELKEIMFSICLNKPDSFREILDHLAATGRINFEINGLTVIIKKGMR